MYCRKKFSCFPDLLFENRTGASLYDFVIIACSGSQNVARVYYVNEIQQKYLLYENCRHFFQHVDLRIFEEWH